MGIKGLSQLIGDNAPQAIKENEIKNFFGTDFPHIISRLKLSYNLPFDRSKSGY